MATSSGSHQRITTVCTVREVMCAFDGAPDIVPVRIIRWLSRYDEEAIRALAVMQRGRMLGLVDPDRLVAFFQMKRV